MSSLPSLGTSSSTLFVAAETPFLKAVLFQQPLFTGLIETMQDAVAIMDDRHCLLLANAAFLHMFDIKEPSEKSGELSMQTVLPEPALWHALSRVITEGQSETLTLKRMLPTSGNQYLSITLLPLHFSGDADMVRPNACVCLFQDETAIRRTEKMRRDFVANVSHELRTPLSAIHGYAETLLDGALDDPAVAKDFMDIIFRHSQRLKQLVADLLDLSKLESPDFALELSPLSLTSIIQPVVSLAEKQALQKGLTLSVNLPRGLPLVMAHPSTLEQVITNLVDNAIKYTPHGGHITLSAGWSEKYPGKIQVSIHDTGIGIPTKYLPRVFERFFRVDKARSRDMGGTGLGLSIVKHIIQSHGGDIWVESIVGEGSVFIFTL
ncbi:MAG: ATP-binding protein, partial [Vampirovibrionales bacterium]